MQLNRRPSHHMQLLRMPKYEMCVLQVVLYCGDLLSPAQYAELALDKFNIHVAPDFQVRLRTPPPCMGT